MSETAVLDRVRELAPLIRERAATAEKDRRLPDQSVKELKESGLMRLLQPKRYSAEMRLEFGRLVSPDLQLLGGGYSEPQMDENIRKYEEIGTHPAANHNAISAALAFHRSIGAERKIARLRYLRDRWAKRLLAQSDRVSVPTPLDSPNAGAIALVRFAGAWDD